jgi:hypothetical protein
MAYAAETPLPGRGPAAITPVNTMSNYEISHSDQSARPGHRPSGYRLHPAVMAATSLDQYPGSAS